MEKNKPFMLLIFMIGFVAAAIVCAVIYQLYLVKYETRKQDLLRLVTNQSRFLEFVANNGNDEARKSLACMLSDENILNFRNDPDKFTYLQDQMVLRSVGETGKIIAGKKIGDQLVFFPLTKSEDQVIPNPLPWDAEVPGPMRLALEGHSDFSEFVAFDGNDVLISYDYVKSLDIGLISRVNLGEVRAPYITYGLITGIVGVLAIIFGYIVYRRFGLPYINHLIDEAIGHKKAFDNAKSESNWAKNKLDESEKKYQSIFDNSDDPMWIMSGGKFIHCNEAAVRTFKCQSVDDFKNVHPSEFSPERQNDGQCSFIKAEEMMKSALEKGYARFFWTHCRVNNKQPFPAEVTLTKIEIDHKPALHAMVRDITDKKAIEDSLQKALVDAERANVAKSEFLASMSHEFRTPLNAILGFSELIKAQYFGPLGSEKYADYIGDIHTSGAHLLELINDILDISAIEAGKYHMEKTSFVFQELVDECFKVVENSAKEKKITLLHVIESDLVEIFTHKRGLKQILINILDNGIKYNDVGGHVTLTCSIKDRDIHIAVEDDGFGIDKNFLPRVMEPFSRADQNAYHAEDGNGLGLSICHKLIDAYGGFLALKSEYGKGTKVSIMIPEVVDQSNLAVLPAS